MASSITMLPPELLQQIIQLLPISSLLAFSATNKDNQIQALSALQSLNLAVLPRQLHNTVAFMHQPRNNCSSLHQIGKTTSIFVSSNQDAKDTTSKPNQNWEEQVTAQNVIATDILKKTSLRSLKSLTLQLYDLSSSELSSTIATSFPNLRELELRFSHSHIHDKSLPGLYWREPGRGTPAWNALAGVGDANERNLRVHNLQSLSIERGSLTSTQLRRLVQANPRLRKLYLNNVRGVDKDFVKWLGDRCGQPDCLLQEIVLENCSELVMTRENDFQWMAHLSQNENLQCLSFSKCRNVRHELMTRILDDDDYEDWRLDDIKVLIPPKGPLRRYGVAQEANEQPACPNKSVEAKTGTITLRAGIIEVDPMYVSLPVAAAA